MQIEKYTPQDPLGLGSGPICKGVTFYIATAIQNLPLVKITDEEKFTELNSLCKLLEDCKNAYQGRPTTEDSLLVKSLAQMNHERLQALLEKN